VKKAKNDQRVAELVRKGREKGDAEMSEEQIDKCVIDIVNSNLKLFEDPTIFISFFTAAADDPTDNTSEGWGSFSNRGYHANPTLVHNKQSNATINPKDLIANGFTRVPGNLFVTSNVLNNYAVERLLQILFYQHPGRGWRSCGGEKRVKKVGMGAERHRVPVEGLRCTAMITRATRDHGYHCHIKDRGTPCNHDLPAGLHELRDTLHRAWGVSTGLSSSSSSSPSSSSPSSSSSSSPAAAAAAT
jgi:hypothetical protein